MAKSAKYTIVFFLIFFIHAIVASALAGPIKIMPLGDSITQGFSSGVADEEFQVSYRKVLYDKLKAAGHGVNDEIFVGTLFSGESVPDFDPDHEGHPGWRADEIVIGRTGSGEGKLADWLIAEGPDIVLLHIGTNDVNSSNEDWNKVEDILVVIDDYEFASGKAVWVIIALIIDRSCDPFLPPCSKSLETSNFNDDVRDFVFFPRQAGGDQIVLVDMQNRAGINYDRWDMGGDMWDDLHPFMTGYAKMADVWYYAIQQILNPPASLLYTPVTPCSIIDTRNTSADIIDASTQRNFYVHGGGSIIAAQGGNAAGCPSPSGEPLAAHINMIAVTPTGKGNLRAFPLGAGPTDGLSVNYNNTIDTNLANAGTVQTVTGSGPDITVASNLAAAHTVIKVLGYYYPAP